MVRFASVSVSAGPRSASATAAISVPPQVRKSLAVNSSPRCSRTYSFSCRARQVAEPAVPLVAKEPRAPGLCEQLLDRLRELGVDERRAHLTDLCLPRKSNAIRCAADGHVLLAQRRDPERLRFLRILLRADSEPGEIDQARSRSRRRARGRAPRVSMSSRHRLAEIRQPLREPDQLVELRLLLLRAEVRVVEVLLPPGGVDTGRLQLRAAALDEIQTSFQAGGITSDSIRSSLPASVIRLPRAST